MESYQLLWVAWGLTGIAGCLVILSPLFDDGGDVLRALAAAAVTFGATLWNALNSLLAGLLVFGVAYAAGWFAWRYDQHLLNVVRLAIRYRNRYDAGLLRDRAPYVLLVRSGDGG